jgi:hypothetical protein
MDNYVSKEQYSTDIKQIKVNLEIIISRLDKFCKHSAVSGVSGVSAVSPVSGVSAVSPVSEDSDNILKKKIKTLIANPNDYKEEIETFYAENQRLLRNEEIMGISVPYYKLRIKRIEVTYYPGITQPKEYYEPHELEGLFDKLLIDKTKEIFFLFKDFLTNKILLKAGGKNNKEYKSTKNKVNVIINKKSFIKTIYKNSNNVNYIKINKEYKLLSKFKVLTA